MIEFGRTDAEILRATQAKVPMDWRGFKVLLEFEDAVNKRWLQDFYRIGLREVHLSKGENDKGEDTFYQAEIFQPDRCGPKYCSLCRNMNDQRSITVSICRNAECGFFNREIMDGPVRGVVAVEVPADFIVQADQVQAVTRKGKPVPGLMVNRILTTGVLLVLDRRYPESVLAAVWRTAKALAEIKGWKTKG